MPNSEKLIYDKKLIMIEEEVDKMYSEHFKKMETMKFKTETESNEYSINFYNSVREYIDKRKKELGISTQE